MRKVGVVFFIFLSAFSCFSLEPISIETKPRYLFTFTEIQRKDILVVDGPDNNLVPPIFEGKRGISFFLKDKTVRLYSFSLEKESRVPYENYKEYNWSVVTGANTEYTVKAGNVFSIVRFKNEYRSLTLNPPLGKPFFLALVDNLVLYKDYSKSNLVYYSVAINPDGTFTERNHVETLKLAETGAYGLSVRDGYLLYKGIKLYGSVEQFDDDGNQYNGQSVRCESDVLYGLLTEKQFEYMPTFFDPEGNLFVLDYTKDADQHPVFYYAGRDWGYREKPKKAVTTEAGLRIRLRASTDAFVIDTMKEYQNITRAY